MSFPIKICDVKTRDLLLQVKYSCPHLKGPDDTENRVIGNKKNQGKMFSSADLMCKHLNAAERFNMT